MIHFMRLDRSVTDDHLGLIPYFLSWQDERPAREQFQEKYAHGGGWMPMEGWTLNDDFSLQYGDPTEEDADPPLFPYAKATFRNELVIIYPYAWVVIQQLDGSFEISRMD